MENTNQENKSADIVPSEAEEYTEIAPQYKGKTRKRSSLRTLTRLLVGGLLTGIGGFSNQLESWDIQAVSQIENENIQGEYVPTDRVPDDLPAPNQINSHSKELTSTHQLNPQVESSEDLLRYALIGMVFETQNRVGKMIKTGDQATRAVGQLLLPFLQPISNSRLMSPLTNRFNRLVDRGETEVNQWIETGRKEEIYSRKIADIALYETVDYWIDYFAENPEVVDLVSTQSVSFAEEVIEEVRERTVSADNLLESLYRTVFRRPARVELPPPPPEAQSEILPTQRQSKE